MGQCAQTWSSHRLKFFGRAWWQTQLQHAAAAEAAASPRHIILIICLRNANKLAGGTSLVLSCICFFFFNVIVIVIVMHMRTLGWADMDFIKSNDPKFLEKSEKQKH